MLAFLTSSEVGNTSGGALQRDSAKPEQSFSRKIAYPEEAFPVSDPLVDKWLAVVYSGVYLHAVGESGMAGCTTPAILPPK